MKCHKDRGENIPKEDKILCATAVKENYCYLAKDLVKEFEKYDKRKEDGSLSKKFKKMKYKNEKTGNEFDIDVGYEAFIGPEMFFAPEIISSMYTEPIDSIVDGII